MVPTLSTLRSPYSSLDYKKLITLAHLIVIITILPLGCQAQISVLYSNGPCLILRYLPNGVNNEIHHHHHHHQNHSSWSKGMRNQEIRVKIDGKECSLMSSSWITSIDYQELDGNNEEIKLIWADSETKQLWSGQLNASQGVISNVKGLPVNKDGSNYVNSNIRSLIVTPSSDKLFASLPDLQQLSAFNLEIDNGDDYYVNDGSQASSRQQGVSSLIRILPFSGIKKIGQIAYDDGLDKLFWIEANRCLWSRSLRYKRRLMCITDKRKYGLIHSFALDSESHELYIFYERGRIERLSILENSNESGSDDAEIFNIGNNRKLILNNCLLGSKYIDAKFFTIKVIPDKKNGLLQFYASDTKHNSFRVFNLIKKNEIKENEPEYVLNATSSGIIFTDHPNIYDFVLLGRSKQGHRSKSHVKKSQDESELTSTEMPSSIDTRDSLQAINNDINSNNTSNLNLSAIHHNRISSASKPVSLLNTISTITKSPLSAPSEASPSSKINNEDNSLWQFKTSKSPYASSYDANLAADSFLAPSSASSFPSSVPTTSSSSLLVWGLYASMAIGLVLVAIWTLITLLDLRSTYQKVFNDDTNSSRINLIYVKY